MQAVILAGGSAARLHSFTPDVPTPVIPLFDRPVVEHGVRLLAKHAITDIIVATSRQAQVLQHLGDKSLGRTVPEAILAGPWSVQGWTDEDCLLRREPDQLRR